MPSKNVEPSATDTLNNDSSKVLKDTEGNTAKLKEAVARAEELGKSAKGAAEESVRISWEAISKAEEVSKWAKEASAAAAKASQEAVARAEKITKSAEGAAKA